MARGSAKSIIVRYASILLLAHAGALPGFSFAEPARSIAIGGIFDLSSKPGILWGTAEKNGFLLAIKDFEAANPSIKVRSVIEDSAYSNAKSVSAFHKLTAIDRISYIVGPTWEMFVATMPLCERNKVVCFAPSNHSREFDNQDLRFSFTAYFRESGYSDVIAREVNRRGLTRTVIFAATSPYHDPQVENLLSKLAGQPAAVHRVLEDFKDFRTLIARIPDDADGLLIFLMNSGQLSSFLKQLAEAKRSGIPIFTDDSPIFDESLPEIRSLGFNILYSHQSFPEPIESAWEAKYRRAYGNAPESPSSSIAYDETMLILDCAKRQDGAAEVRDCISATSNYQGMSGIVSFDGRQSSGHREFALTRLN